MLVNIAVTFDKNYVPYACAFLLSLADCASPANKYRIYCVGDGLDRQDQNALCFHLRKHDNIELRFIDAAAHINDLPTIYHFTRSMYSKLFLHRLLPPIDKILYLDIDTIIRRDPADIFTSSLEGYPFAAAPAIAALDFKPQQKIRELNMSLGDYYRDVLHFGAEELACYFNVGVMLLNLQAVAVDKSWRLAADFIKNSCLLSPEQDALNKFFKNNYQKLDPVWNFDSRFLSDISCNHIAKNLYRQYQDAAAKPAIIHYAGRKPWRNPDVPLARYFFYYFRQTLYYEQGVRQIVASGILLTRWQRFWRLPFSQKIKKAGQFFSRRFR